MTTRINKPLERRGSATEDSGTTTTATTCISTRSKKGGRFIGSSRRCQ